ncbi:unnamed protein product [Heterobilharzia americana]|nr:unnamed protein product [Heterobilharzia americana]
MSAQVTTSSRVPISSYDEPPRTISDSNLWSGSFTAEEKLVAQLLNRGSLTVRPNGHMNQSTNPVHVDITYNVVQILGFSQAEETLSISGWFTMRWTDPRLTWSPEEFSDIQEVSLPTTNLWIPDVGVMNGKASTDFDFSAGVRGRVTVNKEGSITWLHGAVLDVTCPLDVSFFPFDYQTCFLILVPWQSGEQQLLLQPFTHGSAVDNSYLPNSNVSEWEIQSVHFVRKKYRSDLNVTYQYVSIAIHLKRQPLYFIVLVLVPFSMLSALACLIFTLDDTGDRLSVALSLVLSMTMYVVIVSTNAPRSMRTLPVLGIFLLDQLGLLSIATILAVMNNKLYQSTELVDWQDFIYAISGTGQGKRRTSDQYPENLYVDRHIDDNHNDNNGRNESSRSNMSKQEPKCKTSSQHSDHLFGKNPSRHHNYLGKYCKPVQLLSRKNNTDATSNNNHDKNRHYINRYFPMYHGGGQFMDYCDSELFLNPTNLTSDTRFRAADGDSDSPIGQARNAKRHLSSNTTNPNIIHNINTINNKNQNDNDNNGRQKQDVLRQHDYKIVHSKFRDNDLLNKSFHAIRNKHKTNTSERSPWMEHLPLSSEQITKQSYLSTPPYKYSSPSITESSSSEEDIDDDNDENDDDGDCGDLNSDNSERIFRTTVTATAAAALAATHVLASSYGATNQNLSHLRTCGGKLNANTNKNIPIDTPNISELSKSRKYSGSALPVKRDHDHLKSKLAARAAINAAFEAAAQTYNISKQQVKRHHESSYFYTSKCRKHYAKRLSKCNITNHYSDHSNEPNVYPYRKLASRLDCIQMITYLFLSTINAIACLILMPKYSQDSNPPAHLIS